MSRAGGVGSGVIVRGNGVIVTNAHVVGNAREVQIGLAVGRTFPGRVLGGDETIDIAVVQIPIDDAPVAVVGDSAPLPEYR